MSFAPDGALAVKSGSEMHGHWKLTGDQLEISLDVMGKPMGTTFRARIKDDRLVLWSGDHSEIYGRVGASFEPAESPSTTGDPVVRKIKGVTYTLPLPPSYRLGEATEYREMWMPTHGDGFTISIKISDRGQTSRPDGSFGTPTCKEFGGGKGGGSQTRKGVERQIYYDIMTCLEGTSLYAQCSVEHTRGYVVKSEAKAALTLQAAEVRTLKTHRARASSSGRGCTRYRRCRSPPPQSRASTSRTRSQRGRSQLANALLRRDLGSGRSS